MPRDPLSRCPPQSKTPKPLANAWTSTSSSGTAAFLSASRFAVEIDGWGSVTARAEGRDHAVDPCERRGGSALPDAPARHRLLPAGRERDFIVEVAAPQPGPGGGAGSGHCRFPCAFTPSTAGGAF